MGRFHDGENLPLVSAIRDRRGRRHLVHGLPASCPAIGRSGATIPFFAVLISAWFGGLGPGVFTHRRWASSSI